MKKHNDCDGLSTYHQISRNCLRGLLIFSFLLFQSFQLSAVGHAQNARLNLNLRNVSIADVFQAIKQQTKLSVVYNLNDVNPNHKVTVSATNEEITSVLNKVLRGTNLSYTIENNHIVLSTAKVENQKVTQSKSHGKEKSIKGVVTDSKGEPLIGVSVQIKGTTKGVMTDIEGKFVVSASKGDVLKLSYVGFKPKTAIAGDTDLNIMLEENSEVLEEVVVTALGIKREQKALTYNVQELKAAELVTVKDANFMNALSGKVAGVTINTSSSGVGGGARVVMRGTKSISGNNNAMYVIDGIPLQNLSAEQPNDLYTGMGQSGDAIASLNADDIESMSVLTGAAAAALYGCDAANGVVMITTKKGKAEKMSVSVSNSTTFSSPFVMPEFQNTYGSDMGDFSSWGAKLAKPSNYQPKDFFQTGYNVTNSVTLSTGTESNQTYFSASSVNARGIIHNNDLDRYNVSFRNSSLMLNKKLEMDLSVMFNNVQEQNMLSQGQYFNPLVPVYLFPRGDDFEKYKVFERYNPSRNFKTQYWPYGDQGMMMQNPYWITERDFFNNDRNRLLMSVALKYNINDWLNVTSRVKYDGNFEVRTRKYGASTANLFAGGPAGAYYKEEVKNVQKYADVMINFNKYIGDFSLTSTIGTSIRDNQYDISNLGGPLHSAPNVFTYSNLNLSGARVIQDGYHEQNQAFFATAQVGYKSMAYLDLTARNDWSTALAGTNTKSIFYPSVGLSTILTEILPIKSNVLSFLKTRLSYSEVGNAPKRYIGKSTYAIQNGLPQTVTYLTDSDLKPERTHSYEFGINSRFWGNKINFDVTLYKSSTYNQLFNPEVSAGAGWNKYYVNGGHISNKGIEMTLGVNQDLGPVKWNTNLTYSLNKNKIVQLLAPKATPKGNDIVSINEMDMGGTDGYRMMLKEGGSMGDIYVNTLKTDEHGYVIVDIVSQTVSQDPNNFVKAGNASPKYTLGWRNNFEWKGFNFGFMVNARVGGVGISATQAKLDAYGVSKASADARDNGGALVNGERIPAKDYYKTIGGGNSGIGSMYVYDATNIRLAEVSLSYDIPMSKTIKFVKSAQVSVIGRNLIMFYNKAPYDPETTASTGTYFQGIDYFMQPSLRNLGFSVKLNF